ncbi:21207_t:CDS:1, partial [Racocetra persica]
VENLREKLRSTKEELKKVERDNDLKEIQDKINFIEEQIELREKLLEKTVLEVIGEKIGELQKIFLKCKIM